ncbi:MAG TPA: hypothetical protein VF522_24450 [Ramlibacter sp.]|uniref:hypothetical protein n=1 Tax=Ramlibacter sp. TaxID=1917967 RepID=UPI002ED2463C
MKPRRFTARCATAALCLLLSACVLVPRTQETWDPECRTIARSMTLQPVQIASFGGCYNEGCAALLVVAGATTAVSAVVSGSIAVVGNAVYWLEKQGRCQRA